MRVLIAIDESQDATVVLAAVKRFPWPGGTEMNVLCVAEMVHPSVLELMGTTVQDVQHKEDLRTATMASEIAADLREAGFAAEGNVVEGDPKTQVVEYAKQCSADLIVVGSESDGRLKRILLGSVATAVVTHAHCSVLVIRNT